MTRARSPLRRVRRNETLAVRDVRQQEPGDDAVENAGGDAGKDHDRKIIEEIRVGDKENGDHELAEVMKNAAGHTDAIEGEAVGLAGGFSFAVHGGKENHSGEAEGGPGDGIQCAEGTAEEEAREQNADNIDQEGRTCSHPAENEDNDQIGESELDAGETGLKGEKGFDPGQSEGQGGEHSEQSHGGNGKRMVLIGCRMQHGHKVRILRRLAVSAGNGVIGIGGGLAVLIGESGPAGSFGGPGPVGVFG